LRIIAIIRDKLGQRIVDYLAKTSPSSWDVVGYHYTGSLPAVIDHPDEILPKDLPQGDLLLYLGQHRKLAELIPDIAHACKVRAVVAAVENGALFPSGLRNQVRTQLARRGIDAVFAAPLCALTEMDSANLVIKEFATHFGTPKLAVECDAGEVVRATMIRGAPCGNTLFVAEKLSGEKSMDLPERVRLLHRQHPCLAAANVDPEMNCSLMGKAAGLVATALDLALEKST
jgi:hypothetical protein